MLKRFLLMVVLLLTSLPILTYANESPVIKHVIYITLDGTRWQDIMQSKAQFPKLWQRYADKMTIYGGAGNAKTMEVASIPVSLPSYQSQMTGAVQSCVVNECGKVRVTTLPENILAGLKLDKRQVAVFSGWPVIADALESNAGSVYSNVGNLAVVDPVTGKPDEEMKKLNHLQTLKSHYHGNRMDEYTFAQALHYFKKYQPVFMWISLVNADNEAHWNHPFIYRQVLASYDSYLDTLFTTLQAMKLDKETMVIITTDHGRGNRGGWVSHGPELPESKQTWAFVMNGELTPVKTEGSASLYNTLSIRPTIERVLRVPS